MVLMMMLVAIKVSVSDGTDDVNDDNSVSQ